MSLPIVFQRAARTEFDQAYDWYEKQKPGLGEEFSGCVQEVLDQIAATPEMHQCIYQDIRRGVVRRFPYSVLYRVKSNKLRIIAVFHGRRDPKIWQARV